MDLPEPVDEMAAPVRPELIDELIDSYVEWREECLFLEDAYDLWASGSAEDRTLAFAAYRAALDREQQASSVYAARCNRIERERAAKPAPARWLHRLGRPGAEAQPHPA
jgi:hypothetical protein